MRVIASFPANNPFGRGVPDGLKVDSAGNVWMVGPGGVIVLSATGKILGRLQLPTGATNMAFGEDYKSLFITAGPNVYRIRTLVKGQVPLYTAP
jgi:gluconolactonase